MRIDKMFTNTKFKLRTLSPTRKSSLDASSSEEETDDEQDHKNDAKNYEEEKLHCANSLNILIKSLQEGLEAFALKNSSHEVDYFAMLNAQILTLEQFKNLLLKNRDKWATLNQCELAIGNCINQIKRELALLKDNSDLSYQNNLHYRNVFEKIIMDNKKNLYEYHDALLKKTMGKKERALFESQKSFVKALSEDKELADDFNEILDKIKKQLDGICYQCFITYAWPVHTKGSDSFVKPFLEILRIHLLHAGLNVELDDQSVIKGNNIEEYMKQIPQCNHWLLFGTESLGYKFDKGTNVRFEIEMEKLRPVDPTKFIFPMIPILLSGDVLTSFPWFIQRRSTIDFKENSYVKNLQELLKHLTLIPKENYELLWKNFNAKHSQYLRMKAHLPSVTRVSQLVRRLSLLSPRLSPKIPPNIAPNISLNIAPHTAPFRPTITSDYFFTSEYPDITNALREFYKTKHDVPPALLSEMPQPINDINLTIIKRKNVKENTREDGKDEKDARTRESVLKYYEDIYQEQKDNNVIVSSQKKSDEGEHLFILLDHQ